MPPKSCVKDKKLLGTPLARAEEASRKRIRARPPMSKRRNLRVPELHSNAPKRVTTPHAAVAAIERRSSVFTRSPEMEGEPQRCPQEGRDAHRHRRRWRRSTKLSPGVSPMPHRGTTVQVRHHQNRPPQHDLGDTAAEAPRPPGFLPPPSSPSTRPRRNATTTATLLAIEPDTRPRRPGPPPRHPRAPTLSTTVG